MTSLPLCYIINVMKPTEIFIIVVSVLAVAVIFFLIFLIYIKFYRGHNRFLLWLRYKFFKNKNKRKKYDAYYSIKPRYISPCEEDYFEIIKSLLNPDYKIFPQVPLSQIVEKHSQANYKTELFRVIDFCVFDSEYYPVLCIEINDATHVTKSRAKRDSKVLEILQSARIPLVVFWTYEGIELLVIKKALKPYGIL